MQKEKYTRQSELDFIKIVATALIICHHFQQVLDIKFDYINFYGGRFYFGWLVEMFFIISGICAFRWIHQIKEGQMGFVVFYLKRVRRLIPLMAFSIILATVFMAGYYFVFHEWWLNIVPTVKDFVLTCFGMQRWFSAELTINNPIWYISVLLLCYIWFYVITYIANKMKISPYIMYLGMILLGVFISMRGVSYPFFNYYTSRGYIAFFLGICFGKLLETINVQKMKYQIISAICCILFIVGAIRGEIIYEYYVVTFLLWPSVIILCKSKWMMRRYNTALLKKWDEYSFDTYIWHLLVLQIVYVILKITGWEFIGTYVGMMVTVVIAFAVGSISHKYLSVPMDKLHGGI